MKLYSDEIEEYKNAIMETPDNIRVNLMSLYDLLDEMVIAGEMDVVVKYV